MSAKKLTPQDFDCPDCHVKAGQKCRSSRGNALPTWHTRRVYKWQDAMAAQKRERSGATVKKPLTAEMLRVLRAAEENRGSISAGRTVTSQGRVEKIPASTITSLIRRGLLEHSYGSEGGIGGRLTSEGRAALANPEVVLDLPVASSSANSDFIDVWMKSLSRSAEGLNFQYEDDRATFRGRVDTSLRGAKWTAMRRIAEHLGAADLKRTRYAATRAIADLYMQQHGWQKPQSHATKKPSTTVNLRVRIVPSRQAFHPSSHEAVLEDAETYDELFKTRGHAAWSQAALAALKKADQRGWTVNNRNLVTRRIEEGK
jgi:hypothetical protein